MTVEKLLCEHKKIKEVWRITENCYSYKEARKHEGELVAIEKEKQWKVFEIDGMRWWRKPKSVIQNFKNIKRV